MKSIFIKLLFQFTTVASVANADLVYVTDLPNFSLLAPCAGSAVAYAIESLTDELCPPGVTALESCACTKNNDGAALSSTISGQVLENCGSTASDDVSSASVVLNNYCNQDKSATPFAQPSNTVTQFISDLPAYSDLAPCAETGLYDAVETLTNDLCPPAAPNLASCACMKNQNSLLVSEYINTQIQEACGTTMSEDVASGQAVFAGYCGLNNGTSSFPTMSQLPGSLTYYISDMAEYSTLAPCVQSAVYYQAMYSMTNEFCPSQPGALASCACVKGGVSDMINSGLRTGVTDSCVSTDSADITSALSVFDLYCSAAKGLVTPTGITTSESTTPYTNAAGAAATTSVPKYTAGTATKTSSKSTPTGASSGDFGTGSNPSSKFTAKKSHVPIGAIVGGAIGGIALICLILFSAWWYRRRRHPSPQPVPAAPPGHDFPPDYFGKPELASTSITPVFGPKDQIQRKLAPVPSPVPSSVLPIAQEKLGAMESPTAPNRPEMPGTTPSAELQLGYVKKPNETHDHERNERQEMDGMSANMNSGPVYEMPDPHAWS